MIVRRKRLGIIKRTGHYVNSFRVIVIATRQGRSTVAAKLRVTPGDELKSAGMPRENLKRWVGNVRKGSIGADALLRQVRQWQTALASGSPSTR
jgi:hypothetical protein